MTRLLEQARHGDAAAMDRLLPLLYQELRRIAELHMRRERPDHTLQPTALVHEAYLRLMGGAEVEWQDRAHFLRAASQTMRRVLVDYARARNAAKRGAELRVTLDEALVAQGDDRTLDMLVLDDALTRLAAADPRWAQVVELRCFAGLDVAEVAKVLDISTATVTRDWRFARAWLVDALHPEGGSKDDGRTV
ncbi:MAG: sigma-70 family RNA polymerase sigma factor [Gemmatimonadota bacterium]